MKMFGINKINILDYGCNSFEDVDSKTKLTEVTIAYDSTGDVGYGGKPNFNKYGKVECRKSLCWTNKTRKEINYKWMLEESKDKPYIIINNVKVFCGLPIICKKTFQVKKAKIDIK